MGFFTRNRPPSQDSFANLMSNAIRQAGETRRIIYDREGFRLSPEGEESHVCYLGNLYADYCAATKESRDDMVRGFVRSWFISSEKIPDDFEDLHPDLLPCLRSRAYFGSIELSMQLDGREPLRLPHEVVGEHLAVALVYDLPESIVSVSQDNLDAWGVTFYEAMEAARKNLAEKEGITFTSAGQGLHVSTTGDCYDATRMILPDLVRRFDVKGDHVVMAPHRDRLIVTGSDDEAGLEAMTAIAEEDLQDTRWISSRAFRLDGDEWQSWLPDVGHPLRQKFAVSQMQNAVQDYGEQKALLDKLNEKNGEDVFVATFNGTQDEDSGEVFSYAVWSKDVLTLLPKVDKLALMRSEGDEPDIVGWDTVASVAGDLMTPQGIYPERYRVTGFPSDGQLKAMRG